MAETLSIAAIIISFIGAVGGISGFVAWRRETRESIDSQWNQQKTSFKEQIESAEKRGAADEALRLRKEYEAWLEASRAQQKLKKIVPDQITAADNEASNRPTNQGELNELIRISTNLPDELLSADDLVLQANAMYQAGDWERAFATYRRAIELDPTDRRARLGWVAAMGKLPGRSPEPGDLLEDLANSGPYDATTTTLFVSSATVDPGGSVSIQVVANAPAKEIGAYTFDLYYDNSLVAAVDAEAFSGAICNPTFRSDAVRITGASASGLSGEVQLATIVFAVGPQEGVTHLRLDVQVLADATIGDPQNMQVVLRNGSITIQA